MAHARLGKLVGHFLGNAAAVAQQLRLQQAGHRGIIPHLRNLLPKRLFQPLGQIPQRAGLPLRDGGHFLAVQQGKNAPRGKGGQLLAAYFGRILPVGAAQQRLPRLQTAHFLVLCIANGLCAPRLRQAHRHPPATAVGALRPVAHRGGKQAAPAAFFLHGIGYNRAPAPPIQQSGGCGEKNEEQIRPQPPARTQLRKQEHAAPDRRQKPCRPEDPRSRRQQTQQQNRRGKRKRDSRQRAHGSSPFPFVLIIANAPADNKCNRPLNAQTPAKKSPLAAAKGEAEQTVGRCQSAVDTSALV